jgi:secondary thiamine-phosphate synthase enzyme
VILPCVRIYQENVTVRTRGQGLLRIDEAVGRVVVAARMREGLCTLFIRHTSASLIIQENAAPSARRDLEAFLVRLAPEGDPHYTHNDEGPDDMPAHLRSALTQTSIAIPLVNGELGLGTWQGIYLWEHRDRGSEREVIVQLLGA